MQLWVSHQCSQGGTCRLSLTALLKLELPSSKSLAQASDRIVLCPSSAHTSFRFHSSSSRPSPRTPSVQQSSQPSLLGVHGRILDEGRTPERIRIRRTFHKGPDLPKYTPSQDPPPLHFAVNTHTHVHLAFSVQRFNVHFRPSQLGVFSHARIATGALAPGRLEVSRPAYRWPQVSFPLHLSMRTTITCAIR